MATQTTTWSYALLHRTVMAVAGIPLADAVTVSKQEITRVAKALGMFLLLGSLCLAGMIAGRTKLPTHPIFGWAALGMCTLVLIWRVCVLVKAVLPLVLERKYLGAAVRYATFCFFWWCVGVAIWSIATPERPITFGILAVVALILWSNYFTRMREVGLNYLVLPVIFFGLVIKALPLIQWGLYLFWPYLLLEVGVCLWIRDLHNRGHSVREVTRNVVQSHKALRIAVMVLKTASTPVRLLSWMFKFVLRAVTLPWRKLPQRVRGFLAKTWPGEIIRGLVGKAPWWFLGPNPKFAVFAITVFVITEGALIDVMCPTDITYHPQVGVEEFFTVNSLPPISGFRKTFAKVVGSGVWTAYADKLAAETGEQEKVGGTAADFFYSANREHVFLLMGHSDQNLKYPVIRKNRRTGATEKVLWVRNPYQGACSEKTGECIILTGCAGEMLLLDESGEPKSAIATPPATGTMFVSEDEGEFAVSLQSCRDANGEAFPGIPTTPVDLGGKPSFTPADYRWITMVSGSPIQSMSQGFALKTRSGTLFYGGDYPSILTPMGEPERLKVPTWDKFWHGEKASGGATDKVTGHTFVASPFTGILVYDDQGNFLEVIGRQIGFRPMAFDQTRRVLYAVNYFQGKVVALDVDHDVVIHEWWVGDSARSAHYYADKDEILVSSASLGFFIIHPNEIPALLRAPQQDDVSKPTVTALK